MMDKKNLAFGKGNFIALCVGLVIVVIGLLLMVSGSSSSDTYNPEIFNAMHTKVAPAITFIGYVSIIYAVMRKPRD